MVKLVLVLNVILIGILAFELTGLSRGGQQVQKCREVFSKALEALVQLASLQVSFA